MEENVGIHKSCSDLMNKTAKQFPVDCLANVIFKLEILR
jgi:hypothetical protein